MTPITRDDIIRHVRNVLRVLIDNEPGVVGAYRWFWLGNLYQLMVLVNGMTPPLKGSKRRGFMGWLFNRPKNETAEAWIIRCANEWLKVEAYEYQTNKRSDRPG